MNWTKHVVPNSGTHPMLGKISPPFFHKVPYVHGNLLQINYQTTNYPTTFFSIYSDNTLHPLLMHHLICGTHLLYVFFRISSLQPSRSAVLIGVGIQVHAMILEIVLEEVFTYTSLIVNELSGSLPFHKFPCG